MAFFCAVDPSAFTEPVAHETVPAEDEPPAELVLVPVLVELLLEPQPVSAMALAVSPAMTPARMINTCYPFRGFR
jgi:hypothetical protein